MQFIITLKELIDYIIFINTKTIKYAYYFTYIYNCILIQMQETNSLKPSPNTYNIILIDKILKLDIYIYI